MNQQSTYFSVALGLELALDTLSPFAFLSLPFLAVFYGRLGTLRMFILMCFSTVFAFFQSTGPILGILTFFHWNLMMVLAMVVGEIVCPFAALLGVYVLHMVLKRLFRKLYVRLTTVPVLT